jgi:hypothetical protein
MQCVTSLTTHITAHIRFLEQDVSILSTLLNAAGLQLRADDPAAMKVRE